MPQATPIRSSKDVHFGNILFSGGPESGDCIFMLLPTSAETFRDREFQYLEQYGYRAAGEHKWKSAGHEIVFTLSTGTQATLNLESEQLTFDARHVYVTRKLQVTG